MDVKPNPRPLETHVDWHHEDVQDESAWTVELTDGRSPRTRRRVERRKGQFGQHARHRARERFRSTGHWAASLRRSNAT